MATITTAVATVKDELGRKRGRSAWLLSVSLVIGAGVTTTRAEVQIDEEVLSPAAQGMQFFISTRVNHRATIVPKGSRIVVIDIGKRSCFFSSSHHGDAGA